MFGQRQRRHQIAPFISNNSSKSNFAIHWYFIKRKTFPPSMFISFNVFLDHLPRFASFAIPNDNQNFIHCLANDFVHFEQYDDKKGAENGERNPSPFERNIII